MSENKYDYKADLLARLKELQYAQLYLEAAAKESQETFLLALRDVAEAQKGMAQLAVEADVNRENLYRALSEEGNPTLSTLTSVLDALGMELLPSLKQIVPTSSEPSPRTTEHSETDSVQINLEAGNTLQSTDWTFGLATPMVGGANNYQCRQDAAMADLPPAHMIAALSEENNLLQEQLAGGA